MAAKTKPMCTVKQLLHLHQQGKGIKSIARILSISKNTVRKYLERANSLNTPLEGLLRLSDEQLANLLSSSEKQASGSSTDLSRYDYLQSQMSYFSQELGKKGVTRLRLWTEYLENVPDGKGYGYTQFCMYLRLWKNRQSISLPQNHKPGDKLFIDFAGVQITITDHATGQTRKSEIFVACLGFSQYGFVQAVPSQKSEDFIEALNDCLYFLGGVPAAVVPDNLKSAVSKTDRYEPAINITLQHWANHYDTCIIPARSRKPKDKSLAENLVKLTYQRILAPLRNEVFYSDQQANEAILKLLEKHHIQPFQRRAGSRKELFENEEKRHLKPLPVHKFSIQKTRWYRVQKNAHIFLGEDEHYYSTPYQYIGQKVKVIYNAKMVRIYSNNNQIALHQRDRREGIYTSCKEHLPSYCHKYLDRSPKYYLQKASEIDPVLRLFFEGIFKGKKHPEQAYKSCDGILNFAKTYSKQIIVLICKKGIELNCYNYTFVKNTLAAKTYKVWQQNEKQAEEQTLPEHKNIRGKNEYT